MSTPSPSVTLTGTLKTIAGANDPGSVRIILVNIGAFVPVALGTEGGGSGDGLGLVEDGYVLSEIEQDIQAAPNGTWSATLWGNYQLSPMGTYYQISIYPSGSTAPACEGAYQFDTAGTFDLSVLSPVYPPDQPSPVVEVEGAQGEQGIQGPVGPTGPEGPDGPPGGSYFTFTQGTPLATWVVVHNLGKFPSVVVEDSTGDLVLGDIHYDNPNQVTLNFSGAFSGVATCN
jgi:hypothetical protein